MTEHKTTEKRAKRTAKTAKAGVVIRSEWPKVRRETDEGQSPTWIVDPRPYAKRERIPDREKALSRAKEIAEAREKQGSAGIALALPTPFRMMALECGEILKPFGKTLRDATEYYVTHLRQQQAIENAGGLRTMREALKDWQAAKEADKKEGEFSHYSLKEIRAMVIAFTEAFGDRTLASMTDTDISKYVADLPHGKYTKRNQRMKLVQFFNFAISKKWLQINPAALTKAPNLGKEDVAILSVQMCQDLLQTAFNDEKADILVPYLAVSLFAGLRPFEADQLQWSKIDMEMMQIEVVKETSKIRETRFIEMNDVLMAWLTPFAYEKGNSKKLRKGRIIGPTFATFRKAWQRIRVQLGYQFKGYNEGSFDEAGRVITDPGPTWPPDCLRHSFASYWLPIHHSRSQLAEYMGNSEAVIKNDYRRAIPARVAEKFWKILPK